VFIRGFRVARTLRILPKHLKAAADNPPDAEGHDSEPENELISIPVATKVGLRFNFSLTPTEISKYLDPLHLLLGYISGIKVTATLLAFHFCCTYTLPAPDSNVNYAGGN